MPGAKQIIATCAAAVTPAAQVRRNRAHPTSNARTTAIGARIDGRWTMTCSGSSPESFAISAMKPCQSGNAYPGCRLPSANSETRSSESLSRSSSFRTRARWNRPSPSTAGATIQSSTPTIPPQKSAHARRGGAATPEGHVRKRRRATPAAATTTSRASVSVSVEPSANVTASAPKTATSDQARVADRLRTPSALASSQPGASTRPVANASLR